jgi:xanthine dehydrogenase accessory factor
LVHPEPVITELRMSWTELSRLISCYETSPGPFCLATLVRVVGSSYRQPGARLLIAPGGRMAGSLSAGCLEEDVAAQASAVWRDNRPRLLVFDLRSRFGCDGFIHVALEPVHKPSEFLEAVRDLKRDRRPFLAVVRSIADPANLGPTEVWHEPTELGVGDFGQTMAPPIRLEVVGGQTDVRPLAQLAGFLNWDVHVRDVATEIPPSDPQSACIVMSHQFGVDLSAVRAACELDYPYIGLVGGRRRRERIFHALLDAGVLALSDLARIHGPAGLDLGAETPEEIALAIAAEVQAALAGREGGALRNRSLPIHEQQSLPLWHALR